MSVDQRRILALTQNPGKPGPVFYVMSRDVRLQDNHALRAAQDAAIDSQQPLIVVFNLLPKTGVRTHEQFMFLLDGVEEVANKVKQLNIGFVLTQGNPTETLPRLLNEHDAGAVYFDLNPLRGPRAMQKAVAAKIEAPCFVVDTHNIIPLWVISDKEEFAAHTIRNKVHKNLAEWLVEPAQTEKHPISSDLFEADFAAARASVTAEKTGVEYRWKAGEDAATKELGAFLNDRLPNYAEDRNVPTRDQQSNLSPYLHYGNISALRVALNTIDHVNEEPLLFQKGKLTSYEGEPTLADSMNAFLEELIVRKELADNYCFYNPNYDDLAGAKDWGRKTLQDHEEDKRDYTYTQDEWEAANTHDEPWNAAQREMMRNGKMHGYMRMYWAKKILEWSASPTEALATAIYLNDKYSIDGGDPNGYTGIMWSIAGIHDRPWFEREVFGKIRYMNRGGLERRFNVEEYIKQWQ